MHPRRLSTAICTTDACPLPANVQVARHLQRQQEAAGRGGMGVGLGADFALRGVGAGRRDGRQQQQQPASALMGGGQGQAGARYVGGSAKPSSSCSLRLFVGRMDSNALQFM